MPTVREIAAFLNEIAPVGEALPGDRVGFQMGEGGVSVVRGLVSLDRSLAAARHAAEIGAQVLVAHHPLIFTPLERVTDDDHLGRTALTLLRGGVAFLAAHTNWDVASGGVNDTLANLFELTDTRPFGQAASVPQLKLVFFSPESATDLILDALSEAGAGRIGLYERCAFRHPGIGTFCGTEGAQPTAGQAGRVESVPEERVEMLLPASLRRAAERALRQTHPYEEPAYDFVSLAGGFGRALGRVGALPEAIPLQSLAERADEQLGTRCLTWGEPDKRIRKLAVIGGSGDGEWKAAQRAGADALLTGEVKQHVALEASESGMALIAAGHYATEQPGCEALRLCLEARYPEVDWSLFEPAPGTSGRPF